MKKHLPNAITCCNLISGCIAVFYAFMGCYTHAFIAIIIGACFDFLDGLVARLLGVSSPIGKELDSLADVVTFGVAPSAMAFSVLANIIPMSAASTPPHVIQSALPFVAFFMAAFSALRLAKFNLDDRQAYGFRGLPTPANALFWSSLIAGGGMSSLVHGCGQFIHPSILIVILLILSCVLLVCDFPLFALKFKALGWKGNEVKFIFIIGCVPLLILLGINGFAAIVVWYVVLSVCCKVFCSC